MISILRAQGCLVIEDDNLAGKKLLEVTKAFFAMNEHYGTRGGVFTYIGHAYLSKLRGIDEVMLKLALVFRRFAAVEALKGKPKLLYLVCCRNEHGEPAPCVSYAVARKKQVFTCPLHGSAYGQAFQKVMTAGGKSKEQLVLLEETKTAIDDNCCPSPNDLSFSEHENKLKKKYFP